MADNAETKRVTLHRIAGVLGVPVEWFFDDKALQRANSASQCLRLWQAIKSEAGRDKALAYLRQIVAEEEV